MCIHVYILKICICVCRERETERVEGERERCIGLGCYALNALLRRSVGSGCTRVGNDFYVVLRSGFRSASTCSHDTITPQLRMYNTMLLVRCCCQHFPVKRYSAVFLWRISPFLLQAAGRVVRVVELLLAACWLSSNSSRIPK